jgi:hypothetical protein
MVQFDVGDGWGDKQWMLPGSCHIIWVVRGIESDRRLHPLMVWRRTWGRRDHRYLTAQGPDDAPEGNVPTAPEHDVEHLATLVVTRLRIEMAIDGL